MKTMGIQQWLMLVLLSVLWGGSFFFMKVALDELPIFTIVLLRVSSAALMLYLFLKITKVVIPSDLKIWRLFFYLGLFNNIIPFALIIYGMTEIASGLASIINATTPLFTIVVAHFATADEKMSFNKVLGVILGILGVSLLVGSQVFAGASQSLVAMIACLIAALSYAISSLFGRQFKVLSVPSSVGAFGQVFASSLLLIPIVLIFDQPLSLEMPSLMSIYSILALGIFSTALAYVLYFKLIEQAGATNAVLVTLLVPLSAIMLGWLVLGERLLLNHLLGMLSIGLGLVAIDGRVLAKLRG